MRGESKQFPAPPDPLVEHLIVLRVLHRQRPYTRTELESALGDLDAASVRDALRELEAVGVVVISGERVRPSQATARLDRLDMICV